MKSLDEIYQIVEESSHETAFNKGEVQGLIETLAKIPEKALLVEIGIQYGRSTSVIAEVKKDHPDWEFVAIDNWKEGVSKEAHDHVLAQIEKYDWDITLANVNSKFGIQFLNGRKFDFIHIDGDHTFQGVLSDCEVYLPYLKSSGFVCFDDYTHPGLESVTDAVGQYMEKNNNFKPVAIYGKKLGVFQKI